MASKRQTENDLEVLKRKRTKMTVNRVTGKKLRFRKASFNLSPMEGIAMGELGRTGMALGRILDRDLFSYIFDLEVKRARRYQNFISILMLHLSPLAGGGGENSLKSCHQTLSYILSEEARETDILGSLGESRFAALLPYADVAAGSQAKTRFENTLKYYDFRSKGYRVAVQQFCFPSYGTVISDFIQTTLSSNPLGEHELKSPYAF